MTPPTAADAWAPPLADLRLVGDGRTAALLSPGATVAWWCAPAFDDAPLCWRLLDPEGGVARFPDLLPVEVDEQPAAPTTTTVLRDRGGLVVVRDGVLRRDDGVVLVRLLRRRSGGLATGPLAVRHELDLGGFEQPRLRWTTERTTASAVHRSRDRSLPVRVRGGQHTVEDGVLVSRLDVSPAQWTALVVGVDADPAGSPEELLAELERADEEQRRRLRSSRLPRTHAQRALDALSVVRACSDPGTGAVVAAPTTSLPEAPGHDRQFDYRYTWLRDASLSTAVAALLGHAGDAARHLEFVHAAWGDEDLLTRPLLDVRGSQVPAEREVEGVTGWEGSRPVRAGNDARDQRQYDSLGLFAEAVSVYLQVGGRLEDRTWSLLKELADGIAEEGADAPDSSGIWEMRDPRPLVAGDIGRWLVLDRAVWIARGWRPWTRRRRWLDARERIAGRVLSAVDGDGLLPQAYGQEPPVPDASALMAVSFGLLGRDDPRAGRLVDVLLERLGDGPFLRRYPAGTDDGFSGEEGAFLPMSFLAVTALAQLGRVDEAQQRLDALCEALPRLLSEEVAPASGRLLGNTPLVWSHAELARAVYVLDAAQRRDRWGSAALWAWRLRRYVRLRRDWRSDPADPRGTPQEDPVQLRDRPAGPPASSIRPRSGGIGRGGGPAAEAVSDALRRGTGSFLEERRRTAVLQTAAAAALSLVGLYQFGVLRSVPELPLPGLDADRVDASGEAYAVLHTPDATLGIASAGVSLVLAGMGAADRHERRPWIPLLLLAKSLADAAGGTYLFAEQLTKHRRICSWCTVSAGLLVATVPAVLPEARAAWRAWRSR